MNFLISLVIIGILVVFFIIPSFNSAKEAIENEISDKVLFDLFHTGRTTVKVAYEDVKFKNISDNKPYDKKVKNYILDMEDIKHISKDSVFNELLDGLYNNNKLGFNDTSNFSKTNKTKFHSSNEIIPNDINSKNDKRLNTNKILNLKSTSHQDETNYDNLFLSIAMIYGNSSKFEFELSDFEILLLKGNLTFQQTYSIWEFFISRGYKNFKENNEFNFHNNFELNNFNSYKFKKHNSKIISESNISQNEIFLFYFVPLKNTIVLVITCSFFWIIYNIQQMFLRKGKNGLILHLACLSFSFSTAYILYEWHYYISSSIIFSQGGISLKHFVDAVLISIFKCHKDDLDVSIEPKNINQFLLKSIVIMVSFSIITFLIFYYHNYSISYIGFYGCLLKIISFITNYVQYDFADILKPSKDICYFVIGFINFLVCNLHRNLKKFNSIEENSDSFYIISEVFTFITVTTIFSYVKYQSLDLGCADEIYSDEDNKDRYKKLDELNNLINFDDNSAAEINKQLRPITFDDILWLIVFIIGFTIYSISLCFSNYLGFCFCMHFFKHMFKLCGTIFKIKHIRIILSLFFILHIIFFTVLTFRDDYKLLNLFGIKSNKTINNFGTVLDLKTLSNSYYSLNPDLKDLIFPFSDYSSREFKLNSQFLNKEEENSISLSYSFKIFLKILSLFYIIFISIINYEYIYLFTDKNIEYSECDIDFASDLIKKVEYVETKKKKKIKSIEFQVIKDDKAKFSFKNFIYINIEFILNYFILIIIVFNLKEIESNLIVKIFYDFLQIIFLLRVSKLLYLYILLF
jgi:hypothetical protein